MTFERELMAGLCLAIVWINSALIVAHALGDLRGLARLRGRLRGTVGTYALGAGEQGPTYRLVQAARTRGDGAIHFHDRRTESVLAASARAVTPQGTFELGGEERGVWVWPTALEVQRATQASSQAEFDALATPALNARGAERIAVVELPASAQVAGGRLQGEKLLGDAEHPLIFSSADPREHLFALQLKVVGVLLGTVVVLCGLTALCFVGPAFGTASQVGALGLFAYFLLVQPLGVWLSETVRLPHEVRRGGTWMRRQLPATA